MELITLPKELGLDMIQCGLAEWFGYNDNGTFAAVTHQDEDETFTITDPDEGKTLTITAEDFFNKHKSLIFDGEMVNEEKGAAAHWWNWASKVNGASVDDYDAYTCDFVLQILLYGEIVYG